LTTVQCGAVQFSNIQVVLFDKDGTLADVQNLLWHLGQKRACLIDAQVPGVQEPLLMAFGLDKAWINPAGLMAVGTRRENEIAAAAYIAKTGRDWVESLTIARSAFLEADQIFQRKADHTPPFSGVLELLRTLNTAGIRVGILSSDTTENVQDFVHRYQLETLVQLVMGADTHLTKPDPGLFQQACTAMGVVPEFTLAIGDSAADVEMARAAIAAGVVGATWGWSHSLVLKNADCCISDPREILVHKSGNITTAF
jgi:phosphoglycolate phosphatase